MSVIEVQGNRKVVTRGAGYFQKAVTFLRLANRDNILTDTIEFRRTIENSTVTLACERATEEDFARMENALMRMEKQDFDHEADVDFHQSVAVASHNIMLISSMELLEAIIMDTGSRYYKIDKYYEKVRQSHRKIYDAIQARNKALAAEEMEKHLQIVYDFTSEAIEKGLVEDD
jgi:GntR family transcriptional repressor for pyruvate dehydrogenase complex